MKDSSVISLAILKINWDRLGKDYIENFVPFVVEALRNSAEEVVSLPDLQSNVENRFGLKLPLNPLRQILNRAVKHGFVKRSSGIFYCNKEKITGTAFEDARSKVVSLYERIIGSISAFAHSSYGLSWSEQEANSAVETFLSDYSLELLYSRAESTEISLSGAPKNASYIVGMFLNQARQSDPQAFEDFTVIVKGYLLSNSIYLPEPGRAAQKFQNTKIFLDSTILLYALGYAGPERQAPAEELIGLLRDYGADLKCFQITFDEIRRILDACASRLRRGDLGSAHGPTIEWFIQTGRTASDIELMIARLPLKMRSFSVVVEQMPERITEFQVDEKGFEAAIDSAIHYSNPRALRHDVDCVAAIGQLRRGRYAFETEACGALFVTSNYELARVARQFYQSDAPEGAVAFCIGDFSLGNLLWLKNPTKAPQLPEKLLIADAFAAIQPPEDLWKAYLAEAARLKEHGDITADEYHALRYSLAAKRSLMEITEGDVGAFAEGTVAEVLKVAKENLRADLQTKLAEEQKKRNDTEQALLEYAKKEADLEARIDYLSENASKYGSLVICSIVLLLLAVGAFLAFPWSPQAIKASWYRYASTALLGLFFLYTIASIVWGTSVVSLFRMLKAILKKWIARILRSLLDRKTI